MCSLWCTLQIHYSTYCLDRLTGDDLSQLGENEMQSGNLRCRNAKSAGAGWRHSWGSERAWTSLLFYLHLTVWSWTNQGFSSQQINCKHVFPHGSEIRSSHDNSVEINIVVIGVDSWRILEKLVELNCEQPVCVKSNQIERRRSPSRCHGGIIVTHRSSLSDQLRSECLYSKAGHRLSSEICQRGWVRVCLEEDSRLRSLPKG